MDSNWGMNEDVCDYFYFLCFFCVLFFVCGGLDDDGLILDVSLLILDIVMLFVDFGLEFEVLVLVMVLLYVVFMVYLEGYNMMDEVFFK